MLYHATDARETFRNALENIKNCVAVATKAYEGLSQPIRPSSSLRSP